MLHDATLAALNDCSRAALAATNGHGRRWAVARCVRALTAQGTSPRIAEMSARAAVAVAEQIKLTALQRAADRQFVVEITQQVMAAARRDILALRQRASIRR